MLKQHISFPLQPQSTAIILNGSRTSAPFSWCAYQHLIVVDGAWNDFSQVQEKGRDVVTQIEKLSVLGDGDSIVQRPVDFIATPNQSMTDFEKALLFAMDLGVRQADVYWASGGEMDHFLGNLSVAAKYATKIKLRFIDETQYYFYISEPSRTSIFQGQGKTISIYPFSRATVASEGLAYALDGLCLSQHHQQSLRNEITSETAHIDMNVGRAWLFISR